MAKHKQPFKFVRKWVKIVELPDGSKSEKRMLEYEASFWEGPTRADDEGRYVLKRCFDQVIDGRLLNTSTNVSYFSELKKALKGWLR